MMVRSAPKSCAADGRRPARWQALETAAVVAGSGSSVPGLVSSMASIAPRPRTSAMTWYLLPSP